MRAQENRSTIEAEHDCSSVRERLAGYLDGALPSREHGRLGEHLEQCENCRRELQRYRELSHLMSRVECAAPPKELAFEVRNAISRARHTPPWHVRLGNRAVLFLDNMLEPIAVPATGGMLAAMFVFVVVLHNLFLGIPLGAVPNDVPMNLTQEARLLSLAHFPAAGDEWVVEGSTARVVVAEVTINEHGQAVAYDILAGPNDAAVRRQMDQVILFSRFRPAMSFGRPISGGRVVLNLTEIRVKG